MSKKIFTVLIILVTLVGCGHRDAQEAIKKILNDPDSAKFSELTEGKNAGDVCGMVNAKNRMGGYVGNTPFYYLKEIGYAEFVRTPSDSDFQMLWSQMKFGNFKEKFMELAMECRTTDEWERICKTKSPIKQNSLCPIMTEKGGTFYNTMKEKFDGQH